MKYQLIATFNPKDAIYASNIWYSIYNAFRELVRTYCYSTSAYSIEKTSLEIKKRLLGVIIGNMRLRITILEV